MFNLTRNARSHDEEVLNFLLEEDSPERTLDVIELCLSVVDTYARTDEFKSKHIFQVSPDEAIAELNERFKEHGLGYQFEAGRIIRVDSEFIHSEVVKPALLFLSSDEYAGANEEFLKAHEHYRHGRNKECLVECLKSFESTLKAICKIRGWAYNSNDTARALVAKCLSEGLLTFSKIVDRPG
jgi:hypothetical protein